MKRARLPQAARVDANQAEIVLGLQKIGAYWLPLGYPVDGLVGYRQRWIPVELKDGTKPPSRRRLTDAQLHFFRECQGYLLPAVVAYSFEDLMTQLDAITLRGVIS